MDFDVKQLSNGIPVIYMSRPSWHSAYVAAYVRSGPLFESRRTVGIGHVLEHLIFQGTVKYADVYEVMRACPSLDAVTYKHFTKYFYVRERNRALNSLPVLAEILRHPVFSQAKLDKEIDVIKAEVTGNSQSPIYAIYDEMQKMLYGKSQLSRNVIGKIDNIANLSIEQLRQYHQKYYTADNIVLVMAGNIAEDFMHTAQMSFGDMPKSLAKVTNYFPVASQRALKVKTLECETELLYSLIGFPAFPFNHEDYPALRVLMHILAGNELSRLFQDLRETRGMCYDPRGSVRGYPWAGDCVLECALDPDDFCDYLNIVCRIIRNLKEKGVREQELVGALDYFDEMFEISQDAFDIIFQDYAQDLLFLDSIIDLRMFSQRIASVTNKDIIKVAQRLFLREKMNLVWLGPKLPSFNRSLLVL